MSEGTRVTTEAPQERRALAALALLWLAHTAANYSWLKLDTRPPYWDMAGHVNLTIQTARLPFLADAAAAVKGLFALGPYPPLLYWLAAPLAAILAPTADVVTGVNALFLGLMLLSVYGLGHHFGGRGVGLLAATIISLYPILYGLSRRYVLDYPLTALVALAIWLLVESEGWSRRGLSLLCGVTIGLGMLVKWTFAVYVAAPLLFSLIALLTRRKWRRLFNLALGGLAAALVAGPWYWLNWRELFVFIRASGEYGKVVSPAHTDFWSGIAYYADAFVRYQVLLPLALLFPVGLLLCLAGLKAWRDRLLPLAFLLLGWVGVPLLIFALYSTTDPRYTMPCLPAAALATALGLQYIRPFWLRGALLVLLAGYAIWQFVGLTWGLSNRLLPGRLANRLDVSIGAARYPVYVECGVHIACAYRAVNWQTGKIMQDLMADAQPLVGQPARLTVVANISCFEPNVFTYYALAKQLPVQVRDVTGFFQVRDAEKRLLASDYVLTKTGNLGPAWSLQEAPALRNRLADKESALGERFELVGRYPLPDGEIAQLYRQRREGAERRSVLLPVTDDSQPLPGLKARQFFPRMIK